MLFRYGMPFRVPLSEGGGSYIATRITDPSGLKEDARYKFFGKVGLALIVVGTGFQALGTVLTI